MFHSKDNSGKTSKKHSEDYKNLDAEGDEDWWRLSRMHERYFQDLVDVIMFSNAKLAFYLRAVVSSFYFIWCRDWECGKHFMPLPYFASLSYLLSFTISLFDFLHSFLLLWHTPFCIHLHILKNRMWNTLMFQEESQAITASAA